MARIIATPGDTAGLARYGARMGVERISVALTDVPGLLGLKPEQVDRARADGSLVTARVRRTIIVKTRDLRAYAKAHGLHVPDLTLDDARAG